MEVTIGKDGLGMSWQEEFTEETECVYCDGIARIAFVTHEGFCDHDTKRILSLHDSDDGLWVHDCCAVAVYFCKKCLKPTAIMNQA